MPRASKADRWLWLVFGLLIALLAAHAIGVVQDYAASIASPIEGDYGEGIVWQQAALMLGPRAYSRSVALPFVVFHYPPVYHLIVRAVAGSDPNLLANGRLVSAVASVSLAPLVACLVLVCVVPPGCRIGWPAIVTAAIAGLLVLCLHAVRTWGMYMRVDMVALALSLAGLLVGLLANGRFWGTLAGLLLCVLAVYTKQTQLPAGMALLLLAAFRNPRGAIPAAAIAGAAGVGALLWLQLVTDGGFWQNIIGYNQNRLALIQAYWVFWPERSGAPLMFLMPIAALVILSALVRGGPGPALKGLRSADRAAASRAGLLLCFALSSAFLPFTTLKSGSNYNYLLEWLSLGCVLIGILFHSLAFDGNTSRVSAYAAATVILLTTATLPLREMDDEPDPVELARHRQLVARFAEAGKPILSENMTLLMQAGKSVVAEPAIVTELAERGQWDEAPLLAMIHEHQFAFIATTGYANRRTENVDAAIHQSYPRLEAVEDRFLLHLPPE